MTLFDVCCNVIVGLTFARICVVWVVSDLIYGRTSNVASFQMKKKYSEEKKVFRREKKVFRREKKSIQKRKKYSDKEKKYSDEEKIIQMKRKLFR